MLKIITLLLVFLWVAPIRADWIKPGDEIELGKNEGLALFGVDSDGALTDIKLDRLGSLFYLPRLQGLNAGHSLRLLKLPVGEYEFHSIHWGHLYYWDLDEMPGARFRIEPGVINYVGSLTSIGGFQSRRVSIRNQALTARLELGSNFPGLPARYPWRFTGSFPDPFIEFMVAEQKTAGVADLAGLPGSKSADKTDPPKRSEHDEKTKTVKLLKPRKTRQRPSNPLLQPNLPEPDADQQRWATTLFDSSRVESVTLSPSGNYDIEHRIQARHHLINCIDVQTGQNTLLYKSDHAHEDIEWIDPQHLVLTYQENLKRISQRIQILADGTGKSERIPFAGMVLTAAPEQNGEVIYVSTENSSTDPVKLYRLNLAGQLSPGLFNSRRQLFANMKRDALWVSDAYGEPRLVVTVDRGGETGAAFFPPGARKSVEFTLPDVPNEIFNLAGFDRQGTLLAFSNRQRDHIELVEFDPLTSSIGRTVFSRPGSDLHSSVRDHQRAIIGVRFVENGQLQTRLFDQADEKLLARLRKALPGRGLEVGTASSNGNRLVHAYSATDPGSYYIYSGHEKMLRLLSTSRPHLEEVQLARTERLVNKTTDGFEIESFLTRMPVATGKLQPLLVMPHGGPIGVFDMEVFDPEAQYLAQLGYAVLQVNYRGSGNRGESTEKQGHGEWGRGIESDINSAVDAVLARGEIDPRRIAALGTSYGGYSAVMLGIRYPQRYRAAVSIAGVSDALLQFTGGDITQSARFQEGLVEIMGDPRKETETLRAISPVYRYREIQNPLLLVHDVGDERVVFEHALRLQAMLRIRGVEVPLIQTDDDAHGLVLSRTAIRTWPQIAAFLDRALAVATSLH